MGYPSLEPRPVLAEAHTHLTFLIILLIVEILFAYFTPEVLNELLIVEHVL